MDSLFRNTSTPTKTESEKAFVLGFINMLGNVKVFIMSICVAVIFAILLVAANSMAMSIRERTREIGILKALGFRRPQILGLLMGESIFIGVFGSMIGVIITKLIFMNLDMAQRSGGFIGKVRVPIEIILICAAVGLIIGVLASGLPALQASRKSVLDALRRVD